MSNEKHSEYMNALLRLAKGETVAVTLDKQRQAINAGLRGLYLRQREREAKIAKILGVRSRSQGQGQGQDQDQGK